MTRPGATLPLLRGSTTLESALDEEEDMLRDLAYPEQRVDFFVALYRQREEIAKIASHHLGFGRSETGRLGGVNEWIHGSFNVCIPIYVGRRQKDQAPEKRAFIRFPLPSKLGESTHPGNVDEKLRCEAATFIWMQEHCPEIPIPQLFTKPDRVSLTTRVLWSFQRCISWLLGYPLPCRYVSHYRSSMLDNGYLVMDDTWDQARQQRVKRTNLFRDLSRIMLSLSRTPLPRIGPWTLDSDGHLRLTNRPLTLRLHQLENGGISTNIGRSLNYSTADAYYQDLLSCHDSRIRSQPNSLLDAEDGRAQMARLTIMRALMPHFATRELREGPFLYRLTDLHPSNLFVDGDWPIKCAIDLEWACSLPAETLRPPYWLTGRSVDDLPDEHLDVFRQLHDEFVDVFEGEEGSFPPINNAGSFRTNLMRKTWQTGGFWYFQALDSPKGLYNLFQQRIHPIFRSNTEVGSDSSRIVSDYWAADVEEVIAAKLRDKEEYEEKLRQRFANASDQPGPSTS
ncbi:hypothetical protein BO71DRAFT_417271 [Aspergillus ellipticus CBS 707.79]|uniref:Aminoglycoside phosphotransferase domain-containing protein n=1 Tax=Aspergillus ellipticus CBS 707.79 TaxID=1448320 RepID=A0A319DSW5_9EURO|nr:hypothetical protein BO71DRAFT_417271 [Aspergillus ellipticus CBS 707.79]